MKKTVLKTIAAACLLVLLTLTLSGCGTVSESVFDGSRTADENIFRMNYTTLNREDSADLVLAEGEQLHIEYAHTQGTVDIVVGMDGQTPLYRGSGQKNGEMLLPISEAGTYHISVTGHKAKGSIAFVRVTTAEN